jgi:hypothetical protein
MDVIMAGLLGKISTLKEAVTFSYNYSRLTVFLDFILSFFIFLG